MKRSKKPVALLTMCLLMLNTVSAFAADGDIWVKASKTKLGAAEEIVLDDSKLGDILLSPEEYLYEKGGKVYEVTDLNNEFKADKKNYLDNLTKNNAGAPLPSVTVVEISKVEAINRTTIGVEFSKKLSTELNNVKLKELFSVEGLIINDIIPSENRMSAEIVTEAQVPGKSYDVKYDKKSVGSIVAPDYFAEIKLSVDKTDVVIVPSSPTPETVKVTAELDKYFPKKSVVTLEFDAPYGTINKEGIVKADEKLELVYKPSETKNAHVHTITAKVKNVKGPEGETAGADYENYANAKINPVSINVTISSEIEDVKSYILNVAYTDEADRVVLKTGKDQVIDGRLQGILQHSPAELTKKDPGNAVLYTYVHDILYSRIDEAVNRAVAKGPFATNEAAIAAVEGELKTVFKIGAKDITPEMLKQTLKHWDKNCLFTAEIDKLPLAEIIDYYKLLRKFVVFDDIKNVAAPQAPDFIYVPEYVYQNSQDTLVIVLPGRRVKTKPYTSVETETELKSAAYLADNATHQVHMVGNDVKDKYMLLGSPSFRLEDAKMLRLKSVSAKLDVLREKSTCCDLYWENKMTGGGSNCLFPATEEIAAVTDMYYTPENSHDIQATTMKTAEITVQFSESVLAFKDMAAGSKYDTYNFVNRRSDTPLKQQSMWNNSVLNPRNWVIDGYNLGVDLPGRVSIRLVSSDESKQLRDAVVISIDYNEGDSKDFVTELVEKAVNANHVIQVNTVGDWAGATDQANIVSTQEERYDGKEVASESGVKTRYAGNAFVVMAAAQPDTAGVIANEYQIGVEADQILTETRDVVHVLFSEPVDASMRDARTYALNGEPLPIQGTEIVKGLRGVAGFELSDCAVTIILPDGHLQGKKTPHILTVKAIKGANDEFAKQTEALQLPYAVKPITLDGKNASFESYDEAVNVGNVYSLVQTSVGTCGASTGTLVDPKPEGPIDPNVQAAKDAKKVDDMIAGLPKPADITDEATATTANAKVKPVREAYENLSALAKPLVTKLADLEAIEKAIANKLSVAEYALSGLGGTTNVKVYPKAPKVLADVKKVVINGTDYEGAALVVKPDHVRVQVELPKAAIKDVEVHFADGTSGVAAKK